MKWGSRSLSLCFAIILAASMLSCSGVSSSTAPPTPSVSIGSLSPASVTLNQGGSAQAVAVALSRTNFTGSVTLSLSALPAGVSANITQPGTGNSGSISLQAASNAALVANQSITATASGTGAASATGSFSLTVGTPGTPSITISNMSPGSVTLNQGGSAQAVAVSLSRTNFTGSVTLSLSALPTGVSANITQPGTGNSGSVSLQAASNAALVANQSITATASGTGVASATGSFSLSVNPPSSGGISEQMVIVGHTESANFPTANALQSIYSGTPDGFVTSIQLTTTTTTTSQYTFSTFLGGSSSEQVRELFLDGQGNVYVAGRTSSPNLPTTPGAFQPSYPGGPESGFVAKFNPSGQLLFLTYLGGSGDDVIYGLAVDSQGFVYVSGRTTSTDLPATPGAFQTSNAGAEDFFVGKLKPDGTGAVWLTYVGGAASDSARGRLAVDASGAVYVEGATFSTNFPVSSNAFQRSLKGQVDGVIIKLSPDGSRLIYATYLGGTETNVEEGATGGLLVNANGEAYICGFTSAADFPTTPGAFQRNLKGRTDAFVARLSADGSTLLSSTLLGGTGTAFESCEGLNLDAAGNPVVVGMTGSTDFPTTPGAFQTTLRGVTKGFVTKLSSNFSSVLFSTFVGGSGDEEVDGSRIELDASGNLYFMLVTNSTDFPVTPNAIQPSYGGGPHDVVAVKLSADGSQILYSTYLGGNGNEYGRAIRYRKN